MYSPRPLEANISTTFVPIAQPAGRVLPGWSKAATVVLFFCLLIPRGVELQLGTIMIDTPRIVLTLLTMFALNQLFSRVVVLRATPADWLMASHIGIIVLSAVYHEGLSGLENAIANTVDMGMAYFVARVLIFNLFCYRYFIRVALIIAAISAISGLVETFTGYSIIRGAWNVFSSKVGLVRLEEQRYGLFRAHAAFSVHILFGLYCALTFALAVFLDSRSIGMTKGSHWILLALCVLGTLTSLSSGPWLALSLCMACLVYARLMRNVRGRWKLLIFGFLSGFLLLGMLSNRGPILLAINYLTIEPSSGYIRLAMWESVGNLMKDYWLLGWGWGDDWPRVEWYRWTSVDSYYALMLIRSGCLAVITLLGFLGYCWYKLSYMAGRRYFATREAMGWIMATVCFAIVMITVDIFGNMIFACYFFFGAGQVLLASRERRVMPVQHPGGLPSVTNQIRRGGYQNRGCQY